MSKVLEILKTIVIVTLAGTITAALAVILAVLVWGIE